jgi:DAK2 domain fusion protein YloV
MATRAAFAAHRAEIDALNVFPVADGDTGTNLYITLDSALEAARKTQPGSHEGAEPTMAGDAAVLARATLLAARGNSGVIFSQLVRGLSEVVAEATTVGVGGIDGPTLALAMQRASDRAYASVTRPVEGTILSVSAAAARAADRAATTGSDLYAVAHASLAAARVALAETTAQLPSLARAGVVDAGGMGYVLALEALERVITGEASTELPVKPGFHLLPVGPGASDLVDRDGDGCRQHELAGPAYEVMYLLSDSAEDSVSRLRERLDTLGDSVLVVGGEDLWNVHVHVDDVASAIEAGIQAGRPHRIVVTHFGDQRLARGIQGARRAVAVVACAAGEGLASVFRTAGAAVVFTGRGQRPSAGQLLEAISSAGSGCVLVLPNDSDTQLAAEAAASAAGDAGLEVHVVLSRSAVQGIAALAVFEPTASGQVNMVAMSRAAAATRHGAVTKAGKDFLTSLGWCKADDVLGLVDGDVVCIGNDLAMVGVDVVTRLLAGGGELLTVISGADAGLELSAKVAASAREMTRDVEVSIIEGGQGTYPLLFGVE